MLPIHFLDAVFYSVAQTCLGWLGDPLCVLRKYPQLLLFGSLLLKLSNQHLFPAQLRNTSSQLFCAFVVDIQVFYLLCPVSHPPQNLSVAAIDFQFRHPYSMVFAFSLISKYRHSLFVLQIAIRGSGNQAALPESGEHESCTTDSRASTME